MQKDEWEVISMCVTNKMIVDATINNLLKNSERLEELLISVSSGKRINNPSDDPIGISKVLDCRTDLSSIEQYERNIAQGTTWLNQTELVLTEVYNLMLEAQGVAISQANATANLETRAASAEVIGNIYDQIIQLANTKLGNRYIFSGYRTSTAAFSSDGIYTGDTGEINVSTGENAKVTINLTGDDVFLTTDIFGVLDDLKTALENNDASGINDQLDGINNSIDHVTQKTAYVGSRINQMETSENIYANLKLNIQSLLSTTEDIDMIQAVSNLASQQNVYEASLLSAKEIMNMSLVNFM